MDCTCTCEFSSLPPSGMIDEIVKAISHLEGGYHDDSDSEAMTAAEIYVQLLKSCEAIAMATQDMVRAC